MSNINFDFKKYKPILSHIIDFQNNFGLSDIAWEKYCSDLSALRNLFKNGMQDSRQIYQNKSATYAVRYLVPNLIKNIYLIEELSAAGLLNKIHNIVDIGSGPGTFALALACWKYTTRRRDVPLHVMMVEPVIDFHHIFKRIIDNIQSRFGSLINYSFSEQYLSGELNFGQKYDLMLLSNSVSEIFRSPRVSLNHLISNMLKENTIITIIDYPYAEFLGTLDVLSSQLKSKMTCIDYVGCEKPNLNHRKHSNLYEVVDLGKTEKFLNVLGLKAPFACGENLLFVKAIWIPDNSIVWKRSCNILRLFWQYKYAWENHDLEIIKRIFADNAIYHEKKSDSPIKGIRGIQEYWKYNARRQRNVHFHVSKINWASSHAEALWGCRFDRKDLNCKLELDGFMSINIKNYKIIKFTEVFKKTIKENECEEYSKESSLKK